MQRRYRTMEAGDIEGVVSLLKECPGVLLPAWQGCEVFDRALQRNPGLSVVAETDENGDSVLVGCVFGCDDGLRLFVHHLAVHEKYRRQGIALHLLKEVRQRLSAHAGNSASNPKKVLGMILPGNVASTGAVRKAGFQVIREDVVFDNLE